MNNRPNFETMRAQVAVFDAAKKESRVLFLTKDDREIQGTMRRGVWTFDGTIASGGDPRDYDVRITTIGGLDTFIPFDDLVDALLEHKLRWDF